MYLYHNLCQYRERGAGGPRGHVLPEYFLNFKELVRKCVLPPQSQSCSVVPAITLGNYSNKLDIYSSAGPLPPISMLEICFSASQNSYSMKTTLNGGKG